jgi:hypothetical protein
VAGNGTINRAALADDLERARAAAVNSITASHWCKEQHPLGCGSFPDTGSILAVTCSCRNRPRVSSQVSRCLPCLARQLRLGQLLRRRLASHPHSSSANRPVPAGRGWWRPPPPPPVPLSAPGPWCFGAGGYYCDYPPEPSGQHGSAGGVDLLAMAVSIAIARQIFQFALCFDLKADSLLFSQRYGSEAW